MKIFGLFTVQNEYIETAVSIILRVPALFILEAWYKSDPNMALRDAGDNVWMIALAAYYSVVLFAIVLATIPLQHLVTLYMYLISLGLVVAAYYLSDMYVKEEENSSAQSYNTLFTVLRDYGMAKKIFLHFFSQCLIAAVVSYLLDIKDWTRYILLIFTLPIFASLLGISVRDLHTVHNFSMLFIIPMMVFYTLSRLPQSFRIIRDRIYKLLEAITEAGWILVIVTYWHAVVLPVQLLLFWTCLFVSQLYVYYQIKNILSSNGTLLMLLVAMSECCSTPISLFALCITISYFSYYVLTMTKVFLLGWEGLVQDNDLLRGWTEGFTMLLIALQTGLLDIEAIQRAFLMSILLFIVVSSLVQSMYEITDPILLVLSASHNRSLSKHLRVLALCTLLWVLPLYMTYQICSYFDLDFWLMIIISSCVLTTVQVIGSLLVYWLFLYDTLRTETWERLDDVVYYIRSMVRILEFVVAVFVVCFGIYESIYAHWSWLNSGVLIIHCYFNVWQRLQSGWKTFLLRREAVHKIESLPEASPEQLLQHNDVCAICYQEMNSSRITPCGHYFHGCCLRKWLYVKDLCPLCHHAINVSSPSTSTNTETNNGNVNPSDIDVNSSDINDLIDLEELYEVSTESEDQEGSNESSETEMPDDIN